LEAIPQVIGGQVYQFTSWSDGGAAAHTITAPATDTVYTATFTPVVGGTDSADFASQTFLTFMVANQNYDVSVTMKNTGTTIWTPGNYFLGSQNPADNLNWGTNRLNLPYTVNPGDSVTFAFKATAPFSNGTFNMQWRMFRAGSGYFGNPTLSVPVLVQVRGNAAAFVSQNVPGTMTTGQRYTVSITMRNAGTNTWTIDKKHRLGSQNPTDNFTWGLARAYLGASVLPGATYTFTFGINAPTNAGVYDFQWRMIQEAVEIFGETTPNVAVNVLAPGDGAAFISQNVPSLMQSGQTYPVTVVMQNTGTNSWPANSVFKLSSQNPQDNTTWGPSAARIPLSTTVAVGQTATFNFTVSAPTNPATYPFQWRMIHEGVNVFGTPSPSMLVDVLSATNHAVFISQTVPATMYPGQTYTNTVVMKNMGTNTWTSAGGYMLSSISPNDNTVWGPNRITLNAPVAPGATSSLSFVVTAPIVGGNYAWQWQMIQDGSGRFGQPTPLANIPVPSPTNASVFVGQTVQGTMTAGGSYPVSLTFSNAGTTTWSQGGGYSLRLVNPLDGSIWGTNRVALPAPVTPGTSATWSFSVSAPNGAGIYNFQWQLSQDGAGLFGPASPILSINVVPLRDGAEHIGQAGPSFMTLGLAYVVSVTVSNSGTRVWQPGAYQLGAANPADNTIWGANPVNLIAPVNPGGLATFSWSATAPSVAGSYGFQWQMVRVGSTNFGVVTPPKTITVGPQANDAAFGPIVIPSTVPAGRDFAVSLTVTNTGGTTWSTNDLFELVSQNPLTNMVWGVGRIAVPASVPPGQSFVFALTLTAPPTVGQYNCQWQMRQFGRGIFGTPSAGAVINVTAVGNAARFSRRSSRRT
jgi:predicted secreted protein